MLVRKTVRHSHDIVVHDHKRILSSIENSRFRTEVGCFQDCNNTLPYRWNHVLVGGESSMSLSFRLDMALSDWNHCHCSLEALIFFSSSWRELADLVFFIRNTRNETGEENLMRHACENYGLSLLNQGCKPGFLRHGVCNASARDGYKYRVFNGDRVDCYFLPYFLFIVQSRKYFVCLFARMKRNVAIG